MAKCKVCKQPYTPLRMGQVVCCYQCAQKLVEIKREKTEKVKKAVDRKETKAKLEKLKTRQEWAKDAQFEFNRYIRERDANEPCISCGRHHQGQVHAGHYLSRGARPELTFHEDNVHKQCAPCNTHLSGNAVLYRISLIKKIGLDRVEWLEGPHELPKRTVDDYKKIIATYRQKTKELINARS